MNIDRLPPEIYAVLADTRTVLQQIDKLQLDDPIPVDHLILNSTRPLPGHIYTKGKFLHGVHYSSIDLSQHDAMHLIQGAKELDGWVLILGTAAELNEIAAASFSAKSPEYSAMYERIKEKDLLHGTRRAEQICLETWQQMQGASLSSIIQLRPAP